MPLRLQRLSSRISSGQNEVVHPKSYARLIFAAEAGILLIVLRRILSGSVSVYVAPNAVFGRSARVPAPLRRRDGWVGLSLEEGLRSAAEVGRPLVLGQRCFRGCLGAQFRILTSLGDAGKALVPVTRSSADVGGQHRGIAARRSGLAAEAGIARSRETFPAAGGGKPSLPVKASARDTECRCQQRATDSLGPLCEIRPASETAIAGLVWLHRWIVRQLPHLAGFLIRESGR